MCIDINYASNSSAVFCFNFSIEMCLKKTGGHGSGQVRETVAIQQTMKGRRDGVGVWIWTLECRTEMTMAPH